MTSIDNVRAFWDARPCNVRHGVSEVGTRDYFDEVEARRYFVEPHIPSFADFARWRGKRVLEVGCGIGTDAINFARAGADVTVVDLSEKSLDLCRRRFEVYGLPLKSFLGSVEELSDVVPVEPYDLVYSFGVLHHTPLPEWALREIREHLRPGGELRAMVYAKVSTIAIAFGRAQPEAQAGCPIADTYTKLGAKRLFESCRFQVTDIRKDHIFPFDVDAYAQHEYVRRWHWKAMPQPVFRACERFLGWHLLVKAKAR